jgi:cobalt ECF transporter T component CbiQ
MAHGGFTTLGANVFSMGIAGPFAAYAVFKMLRKRNVNPTATVFTTVFVAGIVTYVVTALQLTLIAVTEAPGMAFVDAYLTFFGIFTITQLPISIAESVLMVFFFKYLADIRPELVKDVGYDPSVRNTKGLLDAERKERKNRGRTTFVLFAVVLIVMIALVYVTTFFYDIGGADDAGAEAIFEITGNEQWTDNFIQIGEFGISMLFVVQTAIGVLVLAAAIYFLLRKEHDHGSEFNTVDTAAYRSPMFRWSPLAKLFLVLSLLILNIASPSIWMSVFSGIVGLSLFLYGSSMRPPAVMMRLFIYAQVFIIVAALLFAVIIPANEEAVMSVKILSVRVSFTDAGVSFALLLYARATAALLLMFSFAVSTPIPHLSAALRKLRLPDVFVEMMVLIYRYTFLLMESAERMHLAAECRFGYSGYRKSMRTTSRLFVGIFMRSLDTAERGQITLQCRNYRGEFKSLSDFERRRILPTVLCAAIACAAVIFFFALWKGVLL